MDSLAQTCEGQRTPGSKGEEWVPSIGLDGLWLWGTRRWLCWRMETWPEYWMPLVCPYSVLHQLGQRFFLTFCKFGVVLVFYCHGLKQRKTFFDGVFQPSQSNAWIGLHHSRRTHMIREAWGDCIFPCASLRHNCGFISIMFHIMYFLLMIDVYSSLPFLPKLWSTVCRVEQSKIFATNTPCTEDQGCVWACAVADRGRKDGEKRVACVSVSCCCCRHASLLDGNFPGLWIGGNMLRFFFTTVLLRPCLF